MVAEWTEHVRTDLLGPARTDAIGPVERDVVDLIAAAIGPDASAAETRVAGCAAMGLASALAHAAGRAMRHDPQLFAVLTVWATVAMHAGGILIVETEMNPCLKVSHKFSCEGLRP